MRSSKGRRLSRYHAPSRFHRRLVSSLQRAGPRVPPTCRPSAGLAPAAPAWRRPQPYRGTPPRGAGTATHVFGHIRTRPRALLLAGRERWHLSVVGSPKTVPVIGLRWGVVRDFARPRLPTSTLN